MSQTLSLINHVPAGDPQAPSAGQLQQVAEAIQLQCSRDFAPAWNIRSPHIAVGSSGGIPVHIFKNPDAAGALGYHAVDPQGKPYCHIFTDPSFSDGGSTWLTGPYAISSVISHEVLETLGDLFACDFTVKNNGQAVAKEMCDAVESSGYLVTVGSVPTAVPVSNFLLPAYFNELATKGPFDHLGHLTRPLSLEKGGYEIIATMSGETQKTAAEFGEDYPEWRRDLKLGSFGRTFWRRALHTTVPAGKHLDISKLHYGAE